MPDHVIVHRLSKRYGAVEAVREVSLTIGRGEVFGLLGPNGAGKTTTLECMVGLRDADSGHVSIAGLDVRVQAQAAKEKIGVALQTPALPGRITPREALRLFGSFYRIHDAPAELLARFSLTGQADKAFETLSGGQQQRLALALAFVNRPELVVLDEPTSGLDPQSRLEIRQEIARMKSEGHTVLLSTHQLDEAEQVCDRVAIIDHGRIVATGTPRGLMAQVNAKQTITLVTARPIDATLLTQLADGEAVVITGNSAQWQTGDAAVTLTEVARLLTEQRNELIDLRVSKATLESVFLGLTQAGGPNGASRP